MEITHTLELLDGERHHALQSWPLSPDFEVSVGRARTNTIVVASPLVSRQHATLRFLDGTWVVESLSQLGVWNRGGQRSRLLLVEGEPWSLGEHGPSLRVVKAAAKEELDSQSTIRVRPDTLGILMLDAGKRDREVDEIAKSDFFRRLEQQAESLRARKGAAELDADAAGAHVDRPDPDEVT